MRFVAVLSLAACTGADLPSGDDPGSDPASVPSATDTDLPTAPEKVLSATILNPDTMAPLHDGDLVDLLFSPSQGGGHLWFALGVEGSSGMVGIDPHVIQLSDGEDVTADSAAGTYLLTQGAVEGSWTQSESKALIESMPYEEFLAFDAQEFELVVNVTDLIDSSTTSAAIDLTGVVSIF